MSIFGGILLFVFGCMTGGSLVAYNAYCVKQATYKLAKENQRLREDTYDVKFATEVEKAYSDGYKAGSMQR